MERCWGIMNNPLIDIGINLINRQFKNDAAAVIRKAVEAGVYRMILTGTSISNSEQSAALARQYPGQLFSTAGIHPHDAKNFDEQSIARLRTLLEQPQVVSVGECGLDFDRDFSPRHIQEQCFDAQLQLASETQKPLFLHERAAFERFVSIVNNCLSALPAAVVHCFTGTLAEAKIYLDKGLYLGFTGAITDARRFAHLEEVVKYVPLDRLMLETDAPFMLPKNVPGNLLVRGMERRNEPAFLPFVADTVAYIKKTTPAEIAQCTTENANRFFGLP
jgi:TatD DNase family protein